jgi:hypothetical protein
MLHDAALAGEVLPKQPTVTKLVQRTAQEGLVELRSTWHVGQPASWRGSSGWRRVGMRRPDQRPCLAHDQVMAEMDPLIAEAERRQLLKPG